ncbi:Predicted nucleotide-binding protein containing TIR-like domain [Paenibacillus sp. 1_12]|uniref:TIR domain-containing protein n=1 Tax=Paenibacillus sp. 1_12 TaxID=1566278 RepID=UPI0008E82BD6|nr:nucleotide-binding protein [Paenibacillus sp. 1_12]SFM53846.1 Predicted nucleotide-binding protein containing TIR-like domain [Paenibacillus sp. 1_12]
MVRKSQKSEPLEQPLLLKMTHEEAEKKLTKRLAEGNEILNTHVGSEEQYEEVEARYNKWNDYNLLMLNGMFTSDEITQEYDYAYGDLAVSSSWNESYYYFKNTFNAKMSKLDSIIGRLELMPTELESIQEQIPYIQEKAKPQSIFIGHGRSKLWSRVKSFLHDDYGIDSFTFETESHVGESIVPILEVFMGKASFAILILTAEDEVSEGKIRARQNVIHEAGLFQGRLGFKKAILLRQEGLDDFSNVDGLQYIGFSADNIEQTFYELGRVLKREGVIK